MEHRTVYKQSNKFIMREKGEERRKKRMSQKKYMKTLSQRFIKNH